MVNYFVTKNVFDVIKSLVKNQCTCGAFLLSYGKHLQALKIIFYYGKTLTLNGQVVQVHELLNANDHQCQQGMFKLTMKSNATNFLATPFEMNLLIKM